MPEDYIVWFDQVGMQGRLRTDHHRADIVAIEKRLHRSFSAQIELPTG